MSPYRRLALILSGIAVLASAALPALAKGNSNSSSATAVYINDDWFSDCGVLEDNTVYAGYYITIVVQGDPYPYDLQYELRDKNGTVDYLAVDSWIDCDGPYREILLYRDQGGYRLGSHTLKVTYLADGKTFGNDSFRFTADGN